MLIQHSMYKGVCVCVCVCVWEREREREFISENFRETTVYWLEKLWTELRLTLLQ